jgi:xanthine dehydrogenase accessory factor
MFDDFLTKAAALRADGCPFAIAIVVGFEAPVSGKPGDKAIIQPDGKIWGWIGGGCVESIVVREALNSIHEGNTKLIRIAPTQDSEAEFGIVNYRMTCHGGGAMEIYIEPVLPIPRLIIFGHTVAAQALCRLAKTIGFSVTVVGKHLDRSRFSDADTLLESLDKNQVEAARETYIVVSTQGENDEEALEQALRTEVRYVSFIASRTKAGKVLDFLARKGIAPDVLGRVKAPAGISIHALAQEEIAVSILAEIILARRSKQQSLRAKSSEEIDSACEANDPVCGMTVGSANTIYFSEYGGRTFYFCCTGCKQQFDDQPEKYTATLVATPNPS